MFGLNTIEDVAAVIAITVTVGGCLLGFFRTFHYLSQLLSRIEDAIEDVKNLQRDIDNRQELYNRYFTHDKVQLDDHEKRITRLEEDDDE